MPYDNPDSIVAGTVLLQTISTTCVALRFLGRKRGRQTILISDWMILSALLVAIGLTVVEIYGIINKCFGTPLGADEDPLEAWARIQTLDKLQWAYSALGILGAGLIKLSVCFFYFHIFSTPVFRRVIQVWTVVIALWTISFLVSTLTRCGTHISASWNASLAVVSKYCDTSPAGGWALVASDAATDFITLMIVIPMIFSLHMSTHRKLLTLAAFTIGLLSVIGSVARAYIYMCATFGIHNDFTDDVITFNTAQSVWILIEVHIGIVAACGPTLLPILREIFSKNIHPAFSNYRSSFRSIFVSRKDRSLPFQSGMSTVSEQHLSYPQSRSWIKLEGIQADMHPDESPSSLTWPEKIYTRSDVQVDRYVYERDISYHE